jgi:hypothetical protein
MTSQARVETGMARYNELQSLPTAKLPELARRSASKVGMVYLLGKCMAHDTLKIRIEKNNV